MSKDTKKLHMRETLLTLSPPENIEEEETAVLEHLMFLKEKGDFYIKARRCEDGKKQRKESNRRYALSKMVSLEAIMTP